jgi:hypothetical protein
LLRGEVVLRTIAVRGRRWSAKVLGPLALGRGGDPADLASEIFLESLLPVFYHLATILTWAEFGVEPPDIVTFFLYVAGMLNLLI